MAADQASAIARGIRQVFAGRTIVGLDDRQLLERFIAQSDEAAFEALVVRYGPMVLKVCRGVLRQSQDADDAFQATFLLLVRKAASIRDQRVLAAWLSRTAYRVSMLASVRAARRSAHERAVLRDNASSFASEPEHRELFAALHAELDRLPEKYRAPVVLCYLRGQTHEEAAETLRWPLGTVKGRLARARIVLRDRLSRRGVGPAPAAVCAELSRSYDAPVPVTLIGSTCRTVRILQVGSAFAPAHVAPSVVALVKGGSRMMMFRSLRVAVFVVAGFAVVAAGAVFARPEPAQAPDGHRDRFPARSFAEVSTLSESPEEKSATRALLRAYGRPRQTMEQSGVNSELAASVEGRIVKSVPITKDCMVLAYIPDWSHGNVDNIAVANNGGGVRTLLNWDAIAAEDVEPNGRRFLLAMYSRKTTVSGPTGPLLGFEITKDWPENTCWKTMPSYSEDPVFSLEFAPGDGWKLMDVTALVRAQATSRRKSHGLLLRFLNEDHPDNWSGYGWTSRETNERDGSNNPSREAGSRRPVLLIVDPPNATTDTPRTKTFTYPVGGFY